MPYPERLVDLTPSYSICARGLPGGTVPPPETRPARPDRAVIGSPDVQTSTDNRDMGTLVGRDAELARPRGLLQDAAAGRAVTALVSGDAGIGKSAWSPRRCRSPNATSFTVLCGQCAEIADSVPYLPFVDAFRAAPSHIEQAIKARPVLSACSGRRRAGP